MNLLQERLFEILSWFHSLCKQEGLRYYVVDGTMLGAIRHQGFIPWDDDIDVGMPRKDYERLIEIFRHKGNMNEKFVLETPYSEAKDYLYTYAKIYDTSTTLIERGKVNCKRGIYLDIFPLDGLGNTKEESIKNYKKIDFLNMLLATRVCAIRKERSVYKNFAIILARLLPSCLINEKKLARKIDMICKKVDFDDVKYVGNLMSAYRSREIIDKDLLGAPTEYTFENMSVYGAEKYDAYLTHIFGDWHKLPPKEKQKSNHDCAYLDLDKSYLS